MRRSVELTISGGPYESKRPNAIEAVFRVSDHEIKKCEEGATEGMLDTELYLAKPPVTEETEEIE